MRIERKRIAAISSFTAISEVRIMHKSLAILRKNARRLLRAEHQVGYRIKGDIHLFAAEESPCNFPAKSHPTHCLDMLMRTQPAYEHGDVRST